MKQVLTLALTLALAPSLFRSPSPLHRELRPNARLWITWLPRPCCAFLSPCAASCVKISDTPPLDTLLPNAPSSATSAPASSADMCAGVSLSEQVVRPARATLSSVPKAAMAEEVAGVVTEAVEEVEASTGSDADVKVPVEVDAEAEVGFDWPAWSSVMIMMRLSSRSKLACSVFSLFSLPGIYSISSVPSLFSLFSLSWLSSCAVR